MVKAQVNQNKRLSPFEDSLDLATLVKLKKSGYVIGAYLLSKNQVGDTNNTLQLIFGYTCTGIHPSFNSSKQVEAIAEAFENGCKEIPQGERVTFRWSSFCSDSDIEERYQQRLTTPVSDESEFLDYAQLARTQELIRNKQRKTITLNIYTTFTVKPGGTEPGDPIDRAITKLSNFLQRKFTPTGASELTNKVLTQILEKAINASLRYQQILSSMKLHPSPKSEKQLWKELSNHIGSIPTKVPHTLILDEQGLREEFNESSVSPRRYVEQTHAASVLLNNGVPYADRKWVCLPTRDGSKKYVGVMTLAQKPEIFQSVADQICFLWNVFSRDVIHDIEVITEISPADPKMVRVAQQLITKRSHNTARSNSKTIDVLSQINVERSVDAQKQLYTGDVPEHLALIILVYRDSPEEIDDACRLISGYINQPTELSREIQYSWLIWLETLLLKQKPQLTSPYNRRRTFFTSEVIAMANIVQNATADGQGFELIANEGHSPVNIDFSKTKNLMVTGTTGSGKSVLVASIIAECLSLAMSITMIDLPNDDGSGTFGDFTPYYGGFYFDISKQSNNLVQPLDLSKVPEEQTEDRVKAHRSDVNLILLQLVLGSQQFDGFLAQTIESLIPLGTKAFYEDPDIQRRFTEARVDGLGSTAWTNTPTLVDMEKFFVPERIDLGYQDDNIDKALKYIRLRLQYWKASSIGDAICKPSTFETDSKLITFALTNLQSNKESEVFAMSAYIAASRQSLSCPNSVFFMDEASVLLRFPAFSRLVGRKCATARKSGCRIIIAAQDVISIARSEAGEQILQNMPLRLIGKIVSGAANSFHEHLGIPTEIIENNETFAPDAQQLYTLWLFDYNKTYIKCRYYPSYPLLALVVNSREEQAARDRFKLQYRDKFDWLLHFSKHYVSCIKQGKPL
ncbi:AAA family ATPase [aff. Roholtiella sp. LEGE 12411]|uniref:AAA family ATPase n=1 Tax=aff. Roholtiella sp. LEGE 12411 TaxID=1828822 RepID=UPI001FC84995|nr:AAA family ATPase [aff. Roholtiella sp. LEGE 12411]